MELSSVPIKKHQSNGKLKSPKDYNSTEMMWMLKRSIVYLFLSKGRSIE